MNEMLKKTLRAAAICVAVTGCKSASFMSRQPDAVCVVAPLGGSAVSGKVSFTQEANDVLVEVELSGLSQGPHGIHIHEHGDCSTVGEAAGGHFNPFSRSHGMAAMAESHAGDLGNIVADAKGNARLSLRDQFVQLGGANGVLGRAIIVHAQEDDRVSQPGGNAGGRIACGLITAVVR